MVQWLRMVATKLDDLSSISVPHRRRRELAFFVDASSYTVQYHIYSTHTHTHKCMDAGSHTVQYHIYRTHTHIYIQMHIKNEVKVLEVNSDG